jgi:hypothetical protein
MLKLYILELSITQIDFSPRLVVRY